MDALIQAGLLQQKEVDQRRPTVHITEAGRRVMLEKDPLPEAVRVPFPLARRLCAATSGIEAKDVQTSSPGSDAPQDPPEAALPSPLVAELTQRLKRWRHKTAAAMGIPAYRVLGNATIDRIAEAVPTTSSALEAISGIGPATVEQFGHDLLELVRQSIPPQTQVGQLAAQPEGAGSGVAAGPGEGEPGETLEVASLASAGSAAVGSAAVGTDQSMCSARSASDEPTRLPASDNVLHPADAYWTWRLFRDGYSARQIASIRRCDLSALDSDLIVSAAAGHVIDPSWISAPESVKRWQDVMAEAAISG
jgi:ATP-dependent DNA helicase RecQ